MNKPESINLPPTSDTREVKREITKSWSVPPEREAIHNVCQQIAQLFDQQEWPYEERAEFQVAIEEVAANAAIHGALGLQGSLRNEEKWESIWDEEAKKEEHKGKKINIAASISPEKAVITVKDPGPGFDYESAVKKEFVVDMPAELVNKPRRDWNQEEIAKVLAGLSTSGRGLPLLPLHTDQYEFRDNGSKVILTKYIKAS